MVPETTLRLKAALKALEDVVSPALGQDSALAIEQLELVKRTLALVIEQIPLEPAYMATDAGRDRQLARDLCELLPADHPMRATIAQAVSESEDAFPASVLDTRGIAKAWLDLKQALEHVMPVVADEAGTEGAIFDVMLRYSESRNLAERAWVSATGFDPEPDSLPSMAAAALD